MKSLLVALLVLVGLGVAADRAAVHVADQKVAAQIQQQAGLQAAPSVDITGFPFLTQAVQGDYADVRVALGSAALGLPAGTHADVSLQGVHLPLTAVLRGAVHSLRVDRVEGSATLPYAALAAQLGGDAAVRQQGDGVRITRTVDVAGRPVPVTEDGRLRLQGNTLVLDAQHVSTPGAALPAATMRRLRGQVDLRYRVPTLPFGLALSGVQATAGGVQVSVAASDAVLQG